MSMFTRVAGAAMAVALAAAPAAAAPSAVDLVFYGPYLAKLSDGSELNYHFARTADDPKLDPSFEDSVKLRVAPDGKAEAVIVDLFSDKRAYSIGPIARSGNPVVIAVLENDIREMQKVLGGSPYYMRNRIMDAIRAGEQVEATTFDYDGRSVEGWKVTLKPFLRDQNRDKLGAYADRTYEITFSEGVPGGLYALKSVTPKSGGDKPLLVEELTLQPGAETKK
ncbi:hypothetical protein [Hansschlegelia sp. KR7-227]|uniref:hypothetical protein n=1 Tax=Hansschlegelia sp. KR7-227 TaxID=3400914 RepID=UPI003C0FEBC0